jgi:hypothetical protein
MGDRSIVGDRACAVSELSSVASIECCRLGVDTDGIEYLVRNSKGREAWVEQERIPAKLIKAFGK